MISSRMVPILIAIGVGVGTGVYVFQPLLKEYEADTKGTWILPQDEARIKTLQQQQQQQQQQKDENTSNTSPTEKQFPVSNK
ncbi:uncharacterized protein BX664DRAFT_298330 [Halteromyces radiatus]|uniref:uncharacterized protein n=1 Tax=Halteromyces radiatus TaxID=101107 RepID=UPI0022207030|nr:uncharacterized protein BX664DRAFT_298330 [Halteromyces radiatus]KAI8086019.1 hypothetical protein BX664DRAFT_298330 [Halteromyces radiatus]